MIDTQTEINFSLKQLSVDDGNDIYEMLQELPQTENGFHNMFNGLSFEEFKQELVKRDNESRNENILEGKVPKTTYWFYVENEPAGIVKIRHYLNDSLRENGGHIGYGLAPKFRGKGYSNKMLELTLLEAEKLGIKDVLLVCNPDNYASKSIIIKNGGVLEKETETDSLYWIKNS
jgi:predicted acetyltransferase